LRKAPGPPREYEGFTDEKKRQLEAVQGRGPDTEGGGLFLGENKTSENDRQILDERLFDWQGGQGEVGKIISTSDRKKKKENTNSIHFLAQTTYPS